MFDCRKLLCGLAFSMTATFASGVSAQTITFDEILSSPDDPALNLQFARQEISAGRLQQAASALERLLLTKPNWDSVRLLYGVVLYRMDDLQGAKRELYKLEGRDLTPTQEADRLEFLQRIEHATSPLRVTGQVSIGGRYDANPGLVSDRIADAIVDPFASTPGTELRLPVDGMNDGEDIGLVGAGHIRIEGDIESAPGSLWFFQVDGAATNFDEIDRADTASGTLKAGFVLRRDKLKFTPYVKTTRTWLQGEEFNERWGGGATVSYRVDPRLMVFANGEYMDENYIPTDFSPFNNQRDGDKVSGHIGAVWRATERQNFTITAFASDKDAKNKGYSYEERGVAIQSLTLLGKGAYLSLTGKYSEVDFDRPDGNAFGPFETLTREDERLFARAAIGAPLETIFGEAAQLPEFFKDVVMQVGVSWTRLSSTSNLIEYENTSGDVLFTKKFEF